MKLLLSIYDWLQKNVRPPSAFSWQTVILLSVFSYYMAVLATGFVENLLVNFGWIFLIWGVFWGTTSANQLRIGYSEKERKDGFPLSPWITGALVSIYIFGGDTGEVRREALIYWPVISAAIAALPDFWGEGFSFKKPPLQKRQNLIVLFGTQILLSCWFQFYFVIQDWVVQYPSLLADDFHKSAFVVKRAAATPVTPRGALLLDSMEPKLRDQLNARPWSEVERLLLPEQRQKLLNTLAKQTKQQMSSLEEDSLWQVTSDVSTSGSGYNLELRANWKGPRSGLQEKSMTKPCQITQAYPPTTGETKPINTQQESPSRPVSRVVCQPVKGWGIEEQEPRIVPNDTFIQ